MGAAGRLNVLPRQGLLLTLSPCELELSTTVFCNVPLKLPPSVGVNRCNILLMVIVTIQFAQILLHLLIYDKLNGTFTYTARGASIATQRCQRVPIRYFECDVSSAPFT